MLCSRRLNVKHFTVLSWFSCLLYLNWVVLVIWELLGMKPILTYALKDEKTNVTMQNCQNPPLILIWTTFGIINYTEEIRQDFQQCEYKCAVTNDRRVVDSADVMWFHIEDMKAGDMPQNRSFNQPYVFFAYESPLNMGEDLQKLPKNYFNITMSYRYTTSLLKLRVSKKLFDNKVVRKT
ncbi:unnamed protein product [Gongylonema pulchrum]|uniref:Glyco_tran_10_N domain-containing protein n=1 Tax=Gongylonema pulchrum TaxID=637853 RepID=A0A183D809_9BILA|nr:unnamed protein product [Gongylonema pulchrum]